MEHGERTTAIFRKLTAHPEGMSTPALAMAIDGRRDQHMLSSYGQILRRHEASGRVSGDRWTRDPRWGQPAARIWVITPAGEEWLQDRTLPRPLAKRKPPPDQGRHELLATARELYGPGTPREIRQPLAAELRRAGCRLHEIAAVFDVSPETVRLDVERAGIARGDHQVTVQRVFEVKCTSCPMKALARSGREAGAIRRAHLARPDTAVTAPAVTAPAVAVIPEAPQDELARLLREQSGLDARIARLLGMT
jgi:hypothetical protein